MTLRSVREGSMHRKQAGITLIGWVFLLIPVALLGYAVIRLVPIYLNYTRVARSMEQVASESKADETGAVNPVMVRIGLEKRLDIEGIEFPTVKDFAIHRDGKTWLIDVNYEESAPFISNISLVVTFSKSVACGSAGE
jgi:Domain of unknown function (DUF4845)